MNLGRPPRAGLLLGGIAVALGLAGCRAAVAASPVVAPAAASATAAAPSTSVTAPSTSAPARLPVSTTFVSTTSTPVSSTPTADAVPAATTTTASATTSTANAGPPVRSGANVNEPVGVGDPLRVLVPSVGIDGPIAPAGLLGDGTIAVPEDPKVAGWFIGGPRPGDVGPSVIVGHVDSRKFGLGVFWGLDRVAVGATVTVQTTEAEQRFVVVAVQQIAKVDFPTADVYGLVPNASLRLITCGGSFDRSIGHYRDNVVVYLERIVD